MVGEITADALSRELKDKLESGAMTPKEVESWIGRGVDISKLTAGLAAAAVGGDVNTAAHTGGNAAENNCYKALLAVIYSAVVGKGDLKDGLAQIGRGDDPLSKAINGVIVGGVKLAAEAYPQETKIVLELLTEAGGLVDATVTYLDKKSGGYVSTTWSSIPKDDRDAILGLITVVTLDTNAIKKVAGLKQTAVELKTAEKAASASKIANLDPQNLATAKALADSLRLQSAASPFTREGLLTGEAILRAEPIERLGVGQLKNPAIPKGFAKYSTKTFQSPSGDFQVHFYKNPSTGEVFYGNDYKAVFNKKSGVLKK